MSQPPANPYPANPQGDGPYGSYPPPQQQPAGYPPPQPGAYPPPQPGAYPPPTGAPAPPGQPWGDPNASGQPYGGPGVPPAPRKSSAGKIVLIVLAVLLVLCLGGGAAVFFLVKDEVKEAVDAQDTRVSAPETLAGRPKVTDPNLQDVAEQLESELNRTIPDATSTAGAFYGNPAKRDLVMVAAASGLNPDPTRTLNDFLAGARTSDVEIGAMKTVDAGPLGGVARCGDAKAAKVPLGVCVWSDKGSLGMIMIYFKNGADAQAEFATMRGQIEQKS
ncbi:hypothetical protein [Micromonospora psammae]|uniref:hypothetical protein n=1 Tax=Micromonospora sp. CPCC 205556 TaxID=3122398 RepID=UPI002FEF2940